MERLANLIDGLYKLKDDDWDLSDDESKLLAEVINYLEAEKIQVSNLTTENDQLRTSLGDATERLRKLETSYQLLVRQTTLLRAALKEVL